MRFFYPILTLPLFLLLPMALGGCGEEAPAEPEAPTEVTKATPPVDEKKEEVKTDVKEETKPEEKEEKK